MYRVGLTGGIASGKSTVARRLVEHGAHLIDADVLARRAVERGTPALAAIVEAFGPEMLTEHGQLDRAKLGAVVFHDDEALRRLNAITHPAVAELTRQQLARIEAEDADAVVVYDTPLLVEASIDLGFDLIVVTSAPKHTRLRRLIDERGMDPIQAQARVDAQADEAERLKVADVVIDTDGTLAETVSQADALWLQIVDARRQRGQQRA